MKNYEAEKLKKIIQSKELAMIAQIEVTDSLIIENKRLMQNISKMLIALNEAEAALHMLGCKKKPPTGFIPCEVATYRIVSETIKEIESNKIYQTDKQVAKSYFDAGKSFILQDYLSYIGEKPNFEEFYSQFETVSKSD